MCGLCGTLGGPAHWSQAAGRLDAALTRRAERQHQVRVCNALLHPQRLRLDDWQGSALVLSSPTGKREVLNSLPEVWVTAQAMSGQAIDPLDPALWALLGAPAGQGGAAP
ncbi:hypothetical protein [Hydrogenophaga sp.]|uniref:hypothetical protein n=1 Tax=Hydrogenophaga sp. TaxID=1904254 RepID=UPI00391C5276